MRTETPRALIGLALLMGIVQAPARAQFTSRATLVRVDVAVTRGGRPVERLEAADFELLDNGVPQEISILDPGGIPLSVYLVFDVSSSLSSDELTHLRDAAVSFLDQLGPNDHAALLSFSHDLQLLTPIDARPQQVRQELLKLEPRGATALFDAVAAALLLPAPQDRRTIVMLFSDGKDTLSWMSDTAVDAIASRAEAVTYAVALRDVPRSARDTREPPNVAALRRLADATGGRVALADSSSELKTLFLQAVRDIRGRYLLAYYPKGVPQTGWHSLEVRMRSERADVRFRPGYLAGEP